MPDAVLQHCNACARAAQPLEPWRTRRRVLGFGAQQHPIRLLRLRRIGEGAKRYLDRAFRPFDCQPLDRTPDAGDHIVAIGSSQQAGDDAANAAKPDDGDGFAIRISSARHAVADLLGVSIEPVSPKILAEIATNSADGWFNLPARRLRIAAA